MNTYKTSKALSEIFDCELFLISDQELNHIPENEIFTTKPIIVTGWKHSEETKKIISLKKLGTTPHNKGKLDPICKQRMISNNPMKDPNVAAKVAATKKGKIAHNKILKTFTFICQLCGKSEERRDTVHIRFNKFCSKSCAASHYNSTKRDYSVIMGSRRPRSNKQGREYPSSDQFLP